MLPEKTTKNFKLRLSGPTSVKSRFAEAFLLAALVASTRISDYLIELNVKPGYYLFFLITFPLIIIFLVTIIIREYFKYQVLLTLGEKEIQLHHQYADEKLDNYTISKNQVQEIYIDVAKPEGLERAFNPQVAFLSIKQLGGIEEKFRVSGKYARQILHTARELGYQTGHHPELILVEPKFQRWSLKMGLIGIVAWIVMVGGILILLFSL